MDHLLIVLLPILLADLLNPVLLGGTIYSLSTRRPTLNASVVLLSFFVTYFLAGVIIAVALETLTDYLHIPLYFDYVVELVVAILLFYSAWKQYREGDQHCEEQLTHDRRMTFWGAVTLGVQINLVGLAFAIPYLAAIDQILKAQISVVSTLFVLLLYNVLYVLPFALFIPLRAVYKNKSDAIFAAVNRWMHRVCDKYMPIILFVLGLLLIEDAVSFLLGYREYSFLSLI